VQLGGFAPAFALPVGGSEGLRKETNANSLGCYGQVQKKWQMLRLDRLLSALFAENKPCVSVNLEILKCLFLL